MVDEMSAAVVKEAMQVGVLQWCERLMLLRERKGSVKG